jgi:hypothetical protein
MCKGKWNGLNFDFKTLFDYHKGIGHNNLYQELSIRNMINIDAPPNSLMDSIINPQVKTLER